MKSKISAKVVADSITPSNDRITTLELTLPGFLLSKLNQYKEFSISATEIEDIPFDKVAQSVINDPFIPIVWEKTTKGVESAEYFTDKRDISWFTMNHLKARNQAVERATDANERGLTKKICNMFLEPFMWHKVLMTTTEWGDFFDIECPKYKLSDGEICYSKSDTIAFSCGNEDPLFYNSIKDFTSDLDWLSINISQAEIHMQALAESIWDTLKKD